MCELDAKQLRLPEGITRHPRRIPLDEVLVDRLRRFFEAEHIAGDDYVWPTRPGGGRVRHDRLIGDPSFHMWWTSRVAAAKVSYRSPKTARDTYAVRLRNRGLGLDDIQVLLGHNDVRVTTSIYAPHRYDDVKKRLEELQEHQLTAEEIDKAMMDTRTRIAAARDTGDEQAMSEAVNELRGLVERLPAALGIA